MCGCSQNAAWSSELGALVEHREGSDARPRSDRHSQLLPVLHIHATTRFKFNADASVGSAAEKRRSSVNGALLSRHGSMNSGGIDTVLSSGGAPSSSTEHTTTSSVSHSDDGVNFFYRCPLFQSRAHAALQEDPVAFVYMPTDQVAGLMTVHGVALFLSDD